MTGNFDDDLLTKAPVGELLGLSPASCWSFANEACCGPTIRHLVTTRSGWLREPSRSPAAELEPLLRPCLRGVREGAGQGSGDLTSGGAGELQSSPFRSDGFDHAALVLFNRADYSVVSAVMLPIDAVKERWSTGPTSTAM